MQTRHRKDYRIDEYRSVKDRPTNYNEQQIKAREARLRSHAERIQKELACRNVQKMGF